MRRVLILGAAGMLGHKLWQVLQDGCDTYAALRGRIKDTPCPGLFDAARILEGIDASNWPGLVRAFSQVRPQVVINAVGLVKQRTEAKQALPSLMINAVLPHRLAELCDACGARLIHLSTDCVFSGRKGHYSEDDTPDPQDIYGQTKLLGEVVAGPALTLRTSMIGPELGTARGLIEWFLAQQGGQVRGFRRAVFSGFTTLELARLIRRLILDFPDLYGLYHASVEPISKYDLLVLIREAYGLEIEIEPDDDFVCDRGLVSERLRRAIGYVPPSWPALVAEMRGDPMP